MNKLQNEIKDYTGIEEYYTLVNICASRIFGRAKKRAVNSGNVAVQHSIKKDLQQAGMVALMEAWNNFDDTKKCSFKTYSWYKIKGAMLDYLRNEDTCSRSTRTALKLIRHNTEDNTFTSDTLSDDQINETIKKSTVLYQFSSSDTTSELSEQTYQIEDDDNGYEDIETRETIKNIMKSCELTDREHAIIKGHYFKDQKLYEIGIELGLTESRVSQLHKEALSKLKRYI